MGRFGIGFFSVFMWGNDVDVVSRRFDVGRADTWVLEFRGGVAGRPLLRIADESEQLKEPGTRVRVLLDDETIWRLGVNPGEEAESLRRLCAWLAPASDVTILAGRPAVSAVQAGDWLQLPLDELGARIASMPLRIDADYPPEEVDVEEADSEIPDELREAFERRAAEQRELEEAQAAQVRDTARLLVDGDGRPVGRLSLANGAGSEGVTVVGGLRATTLSRVVGVLEADPTTASRNSGLPTVSPQELARWASEQAVLQQGAEPSAALVYAGIVWTCGGETGPLPIVATAAGHLTSEELLAWAGERDSIVVLQDAALWNDEHAYGEIELLENVVAVNVTPEYLVIGADRSSDSVVSRWPLRGDFTNVYAESSLLSALAKVVGSAWEVQSTVLIGGYYEPTSRTNPAIGLRRGEPVKLDGAVWNRYPEQQDPEEG